MKVINLGLPRTGTTSFKHALEFLGFGPVDHMTQLMGSPQRWPLWPRFAAGEDVQLQLFDGFGAGADSPFCCFGPRLFEVYPNAKFVLNVRDASRWHESYIENIHPVSYTHLTLPTTPYV